MLTEKQFKALAIIVKDEPDITARVTWGVELARWCADFNPRFDKDKFYKACGIEKES